MTQTAQPNPFTPAAKKDPYPIYAQLRETAPVYPLPVPDGRLWLVTRYDDVDRALRDPRLSKAGGALVELPPEVRTMFTSHMLAKDPPDHTRLRKLVSQAFTSRLVENMRPRIQHIADALLDRVMLYGRMDLIDDYAYPLPLTVIAELLGIPEADREPFRRWSYAAVANELSAEPMPQWRRTALAELTAYLDELFARKRREPADDLVSGLLQAEEHGDQLSGDELLAMVFLLVIAGHETTVNLIGNGMLALLRHPAQLRALRADPSLLPGAIEELLRYDGPVETASFRFSTAEVELPSGTIPAGEHVLVVLASANRDDTRFADADTLDIRRAETGHGGTHLAFGKGIHYCLGAPLARMEGQVAIGTLLRRLCPYCARPSGRRRCCGGRAWSFAGCGRSRCCSTSWPAADRRVSGRRPPRGPRAPAIAPPSSSARWRPPGPARTRRG